MKVLGALVLLAMVASAISTEYGSVSFTPEEGMVVPMEIVLDNNSMLSIPSKPENYTGCSNPTVNFHDFDKGLVALKEIRRKKCLVKPTDETYEESKALVEAFNNGRTEPEHQAIEKWTIPTEPIPTSEVGSRFGLKIAKFCKGHQVYDLRHGSVQQTVKVLDSEIDDDEQVSPMCGWWCGRCHLLVAVQ